MRKAHVALLLAIVLILPAVVASAEEPLSVTHTLNGQTEGTDTVTLDITLHVENLGDSPYQGLRFSYVPLSLIAVEEVIVNVGDVAAGQSADVSFSIVTLSPFLEEMLTGSPLPWVGEYTSLDGTGTIIDFPATSHAAGGVL
ncbi:MAG: hypothetical protein V3W31_00540 [Thermodesulfobacteriota bacterium]